MNDNITIEELKEMIIDQLDIEDVIERFQISVKDLVEAFSDRVEEYYEQLLAELAINDDGFGYNEDETS
jgi:hypothetical protein